MSFNESFNKEGKIKTFLTLTMLGYAIVISSLTSNVLPFIAMFFSTCGDFSIMHYRGCARYTLDTRVANGLEIGMMCFAISHIAYMTKNTTLHFRTLLAISSIVFVLLVLSVFCIKLQNLSAGLYAVVLLLNVFNSFNYSVLAAIGGCLFLSSDLILGICDMKKLNDSKWQAAIWVTYVSAQILLLTSTLIGR